MINLLLFPFGGNAQETLVTIMAINKIKPTFKVLGFLDDDKTTWGKKTLGISVLGGKRLVNQYKDAKIIAVPGNPSTFHKREEIISQLKIDSNRFTSIIDPLARVSEDAKIGKNTVIMANCFISCSTRIGNHVLIMSNSVVSHNSKIGDYTLVGSQVCVSGHVKVGKNCYLGSKTSIKDHITISKNSLIGIGSNIINNIPACSVAVGNPAKVIRKINKL